MQNRNGGGGTITVQSGTGLGYHGGHIAILVGDGTGPVDGGSFFLLRMSFKF